MSNNNAVRIIGGKWRGRKIRFPSLSTLRPTGDRTRETLFNWLQPEIMNAVCLDLFAGSGVLAFEALSRGASDVVLVEENASLVHALQDTAKTLETDRAHILRATAPSTALAQQLSRFQFKIIFLDPPFKQQLIEPALQWLTHAIHLKPKAIVYIEVAKNTELDFVESYGEILKQKTAGQVTYLLLQIKVDDGQVASPF